MAVGNKAQKDCVAASHDALVLPIYMITPSRLIGALTQISEVLVSGDAPKVYLMYHFRRKARLIQESSRTIGTQWAVALEKLVGEDPRIID